MAIKHELPLNTSYHRFCLPVAMPSNNTYLTPEVWEVKVGVSVVTEVDRL